MLFRSHSFLVSMCLKRLAFATLVLASIAGIFISLRLTLFPVVFSTFVLLLFLSLPVSSQDYLGHRKKLLTIAGATVVFSLFSLSVAILALPASWDHPVAFLLNGYNQFRDYRPWNGCTLFMGECTSKYLTKSWTASTYLMQ